MKLQGKISDCENMDTANYSGDYRHTGKGNLVKMNPTSVKKVLMEMMKMSQKGD